MATYEILDTQAGDGFSFYLVRVSFDDLSFDQWLVSDKTGKALEKQLQAYADDYAAEYRAAQNG